MKTTTARVYLAGPMTGLPEFNYPAFNAEAARLRALGYQVENPAENPLPAEAPWHQCMRAAIRQMVVCDVVATLPGWDKSRGAQLEVYLADRLEIPSIEAASLTVHQVKPSAEEKP
jgi:nucleoside 2-deoxyribosyltransferase